MKRPSVFKGEIVEEFTHILVALIGFIGVFVSAVFSYLCHRHAREINDAVNHRHIKTGDPNAPKLFDLVWENHQKADELIQWKRSYDGGPLDTGAKASQWVTDISQQIADIKEQIDCNCPGGS